MELQGRELKIEMRGDDVKLLQKELLSLGLEISEQEVARALFGRATREAVSKFQEAHAIAITGSVDERTAKAINAAVDAPPPPPAPPLPPPLPSAFIVTGHVYDKDGVTPVAGVLVKAFDKDLRNEEQLGEAAGVTTDPSGSFSIRYSAKQFARAEKRSADIIARAFTEEGKVIAESAVIFNAEPVQDVRVVIGGGTYRGFSEYELLLADLAPVLQDVAPAELTEDDIRFLAGETGQNPRYIAFVMQAAKLSILTRVPPEAFYGLFREGLPTQLRALLAQSPAAQRRALQNALGAGTIPAKLADDVDAVIERLRQLLVNEALKPADGPTALPLSELLALTLQPEAQRMLLDLYVHHEGDAPEFWQSLRTTEEFKDKVDDLQLTLQFAAVALNHVPMARHLKQLHATGEIASLRDLARFDRNDWLRIISEGGDDGVIGAPETVPGKDWEETVARYASAIVLMVEENFPTPAIAARIEKDEIPAKVDLVRFFATNPEFEFASSPVSLYLTKNPGATAGATDADLLATQLGRLQRVSRMTHRYDQMRVLLDDDLHSARHVARMGRNVFIARYSEALGGAHEALLIYERAHQIAATALHLAANYSPAFNRVRVSVLSSTAQPE
jgi:peptidoglycan hydrolase-like protein with peptidoglycan-binding domain